MKKITFLFTLLIVSIGFSQDLLLGFEIGESGGINGGPFGGMNAPILETDAGSNGTEVAKFVANSGGEVWQGVNINLSSNVDLSSTQTMTMDVYSATPVIFLVKVNGGVDGAPEAAAEVSHSGNSTWQTLSFTFNTSLDGKAVAANGIYSSFVVHAYWKSGVTAFGDVTKDERTFFIDNIKGSAATTSNEGGSDNSEVVLGFETEETGGVNGDPFGGMNAPNVLDGTGANTSKVLEIVGNSATEVWQGINLNLSDNVDLSSTQTMSIDVKSSSAITFLVKVNGGVNGAPEAAAEVTHNGDGTWQTLSIIFNTSLDGKAAAANGQYASFVIHAYWKPGVTAFADVAKDERTFFVDNLKGSKAGATPVVPEPTDAPFTPPSFSSSNVMSIYSEAYTASAVISNVSWDDSDFEEMTIAGNKVLKVTGSNFIGMDLDKHIDITNMTHLHMDYWITTDFSPGQVMNPKLSNHANQDGETSAIDISNPINSQEEVKNWQSKDFQLTGDRESIKQFLITQAGKSTVYYLDNVYLYVSGTARTNNNDLLGFTMYPNPAKNELKISTKETISSVELFNVLGKRVKTFITNSTNKNLDISNLSSGIYLVKYVSAGKVGTAKFIKQ